MRSKSKKLPHYPRIFPALIKAAENSIHWLFLIGILLVNVLYYSNQKPFLWEDRINILTRPYSYIPHLTLANLLKQQGETRFAANELSVSEELYQHEQKSNDVLGVSSPKKGLQQSDTKPKQLKSDYDYWLSVINKRPDYRDAYLAASVLAFQLKQLDNADQLVHRALILDPNNELANKLSQYLTSKQK